MCQSTARCHAVCVWCDIPMWACVIYCPFLWSRCDRLLHRHCLGSPGWAGVHRHRPRQGALLLRGRVRQPLQVCTQDHPQHLPGVQLPAQKLRTQRGVGVWRGILILGCLNRTLIVNLLTLLPRWWCWIGYSAPYLNRGGVLNLEKKTNLEVN